jgi:hypothetical protein
VERGHLEEASTSLLCLEPSVSCFVGIWEMLLEMWCPLLLVGLGRLMQVELSFVLPGSWSTEVCRLCVGFFIDRSSSI